MGTKAGDLENGTRFRWRATPRSDWQYFTVTKEYDGEGMKAQQDGGHDDNFNAYADVEVIS